MTECPATREAVQEREDEGDTGCPICGQSAVMHTPEWFVLVEQQWVSPSHDNEGEAR